MKFGVQFEFHKIPEWYGEYLDYPRLSQMLTRFKNKTNGKIRGNITSYIEDGAAKLKGLYFLTSRNHRAIKLERELLVSVAKMQTIKRRNETLSSAEFSTPRLVSEFSEVSPQKHHEVER